LIDQNPMAKVIVRSSQPKREAMVVLNGEQLEQLCVAPR
jgi:hypothetical protein